MMTTVLGAVINIILDPIFIFVFHLGVKGAALATVLSQAVGAIWILRFLSGKKTILHLRKENFKLQKEIILPCLALGISTFVMLSTESILSISFTSSLSRYGGDLAVAIFGGNKFFCNHLCGRGQLFSKLGGDLKCSRNKPILRWVSSKWFGYGFLIFFLTMFGNMVFQTYLVCAGASSLREAIKRFRNFRVPW